VFNIQIHVHKLYLKPLSVQAQYSNLWPTNSSSSCHGSLRCWNGRTGDPTKFKPLIFSVWGFVLSNIAYIFIFMIMNYFCSSSTQFCYVIVNVRHLESYMHISNRCVPWKIAIGAENPVFYSLQFQQMSFCCKFPGGTGLMRALWRVNLILVLNCSLLSRRYILMNVLKSLASIVSMCSLHVIFLSKMTPRYFTLFTNGISRPFNVRR
jgi:hypothetical protein